MDNVFEMLENQPMLTDPLTLKPINVPASTILYVEAPLSFRTIDVSPGRTIRIATDGSDKKLTLSISHNVSKENKGTDTDRATVKLSVLKQVPNVGPVSSSVSMSFALPRVGFTVQELVNTFETALNVLFVTDGGGTNTGQLERILNGEP